MNTRQSGFSLIEIIIAVALVGAIGAGTFFALSRHHDSGSKPATPAAQTSGVTWNLTGDGYQPSAQPPACPDKMVSVFPADLSKVTSVLYPGQYRGTDYKPHGGLRFDTSANGTITVRAPFDGTLINGAAFQADVPGHDVNYGFDVMNDCGMMYRIGHLLTLSPQLAEIAKALPPATSTDSRTTNIPGNVKIKAGTVLATAVGTSSDKNTFFDWGVYDWNRPNAISGNATWLQDPKHTTPLAKHAVCWFDELPVADETKITSLTAGDSKSAKTSDYCD